MSRLTFRSISGFLVCASLTLGMALAAQSGGKGDAAKGKEVVENSCLGCHNVDSDEAKGGPSLKGLFKRKTLKSGKPVNDANVMDQINNGGGGMPPYGDQLSADEKANLLAYLHTI